MNNSFGRSCDKLQQEFEKPRRKRLALRKELEGCNMTQGKRTVEVDGKEYEIKELDSGKHVISGLPGVRAVNLTDKQAKDAIIKYNLKKAAKAQQKKTESPKKQKSDPNKPVACCGTCRFCLDDKYKGREWKGCHKKASRIGFDVDDKGNDVPYTIFPQVSEKCWCGDHEYKKGVL